jgi:hypothetical protein
VRSRLSGGGERRKDRKRSCTTGIFFVLFLFPVAIGLEKWSNTNLKELNLIVKCIEPDKCTVYLRR